MNRLKYLSIIIILLNNLPVNGQTDSSQVTAKDTKGSVLTIEPGVGFSPMTDLVVTNLIQWNFSKRLSVVSHSSYTVNNAFDREFNYIKTDYGYSLSQKFGVGASLYAKRTTHTLSLMAGIKHDAFKETLNNPEFEKMSVTVSSTSPDFGLLYNIKAGQKKVFFSFRMYIPLYPYPFESSDIYSLDGNISSVSLEFGVGLRLY